MVDAITVNIGVTAPYYALENLRVSDDGATAEFVAEQPMDNEVGEIAAAEVGRHLAVLGACALAWSNPKKEKHYYVASSAVLKNVAKGGEVGKGAFSGTAKILFFDKRYGTISATLMTTQGDPLYELETHYHIMSVPLFAKLFHIKKQEFECNPSNNPYKKQIPLNDVRYSDNTISARLGPLKPEECNGHFCSFPCIPVAILMHSLSRTAGKLLSKVIGEPGIRYTVVAAEVQAYNFAFAGEVVNMIVTYSGLEGGDHVFACKAENNDGKLFGSMLLRLSCSKTA
ncbi:MULTISPECIES: hypothetical protein [Prosthecochloris]|uniref:Uncharacterized protein n=1 Tax=Prosthecochloris marina TaxID=2017681 RepID=A0A317T9K1_9CHLB|nr:MULTISPECIES: hypothetical protein [Prosthecochloris]PWW82106.1 hypothetical protein CR164_07150 [Prosthecochloris marina]UZJ36789.1 hypothetical protein OO005_08500 [Prosthecochloris sp. SCSIO W1103]UZJ39728.1 hypothetical protein OO185_01140 [Prosthecochloris sp. SCSIO W1102]